MEKSLLIIALICSLSLSCSKDSECILLSEEIECADEVFDFGEVLLKESSKEFMVYDGLEDIVFESEDEETVKFIPTRERRISFFNKTFELECIDGSLNQYIYVQEQHSVSYICEALDLGIIMNLLTYHSKVAPAIADKFRVSLFKPSNTNIISTNIIINMTVDDRGYEEEYGSMFECNDMIEYDNSVNILGKRFDDVYSMKQSAPRKLTELFFNNQFGIVGFKDLDSKLWKFDSFE